MKTIRAAIVLVCVLSFPAFAQRPEIYVQTGHASPARSVALSGDGKYLASGSDDHAVKVWDMASGQELKTLRGHTDRVNSVAFSPDSKILASGSWDHKIRLWDVASGRLLQTLSHDEGVNVVAFSPDGRMLASGSFDFTIRVWDVATGREIKKMMPKIEEPGETMRGYQQRLSDDRPPQFVSASFTEVRRGFEPEFVNPSSISRRDPVDGGDPSHIVWGLAWSPDGRRLASCSYVAVRVWDINSGAELKAIAATEEIVLHSVAFGPDGKTLAIGVSPSFEAKTKVFGINLHDAATGRLLKSLNGHESDVWSIVFSPDGSSLASSSWDGTIRFWDILSGRQTKLIKDPVGQVETIAFSRDGRTLVSGSSDKTLRLWDVATTKAIKTFTGHSTSVTGAAVSFDGRSLATGFADGAVRLWDMAGANQLRILRSGKAEPEAEAASALAFSPDGKILATGAVLWDVASGQQLRVLQGAGVVSGVAFSPDGKSLATVGESARLWDVATGSQIQSFRAKDKQGKDLSFGTYIAFVGPRTLATLVGYGDMALWQIETGALLRTLRIRVDVVSSDGRFAVDAGGNSDEQGNKLGEVVLFDLATEQKIRSLAKLPAWSVKFAFTADGNLLAGGGDDGVIKVWSTASGAELHTITSHSGSISSLNFSGDGKTLTSTSEDGRTSVTDMATGNLLASLIAIDQTDWIAVAPDGRFSGSPEGMKLISFVQDNKLLPLDSFFEKGYTPRFLQQVYARDGQSENLGIDFSKKIKLPPLVKITSPKPGSTAATDTAQIVVEATDQGGGVEDIRLYQNGKLLSEESRQLVRNTGTNTRTFDVYLVSGVNTFRATAFNSDRTEATPDEIKIELKAIEASSNLYILAIGLNEYKNTRYNLNYGRPDAQAVADAIEQKGRGIFKQISKRVIFDADATRTNIETAFSDIVKQARPQDAFVFYYAGHGVMSEKDDKNPADFYLVPYDVVRIYGDDGSLAANGIPASTLRELLTKVRAQKQLIILDACESGGALESIAMRGASEEKAIMQLARSAGVAVLASAGQDQVATEFGKLGHGVFTFALLKALGGEADGAPKDGKITVKELEAYINDQVPELTKLYRGKRQDPNSWTRGQDFPITLQQ